MAGPGNHDDLAVLLASFVDEVLPFCAGIRRGVTSIFAMQPDPQAIDQIVAQLAALIEQISQAAEQQAQASAGIAQAMSQISSVTQETAAGAEEASGSVATLTRLADDLRAGVAAFRLERAAAADGYGLTGANGADGDGVGNGYVAEYAGVGGQRAR